MRDYPYLKMRILWPLLSSCLAFFDLMVHFQNRSIFLSISITSFIHRILFLFQGRVSTVFHFVLSFLETVTWENQSSACSGFAMADALSLLCKFNHIFFPLKKEFQRGAGKPRSSRITLRRLRRLLKSCWPFLKARWLAVSTRLKLPSGSRAVRRRVKINPCRF